jgi:hypothetical protein
MKRRIKYSISYVCLAVACPKGQRFDTKQGIWMLLKRLINASDLSDARFRRNAKLGRMFRARLINPFEGGRWGVAADAVGLVSMGFLSCAKESIQPMVISSRLASDDTA